MMSIYGAVFWWGFVVSLIRSYRDEYLVNVPSAPIRKGTLQYVGPDGIENIYPNLPVIHYFPKLDRKIISRAMAPHGYSGNRTRLKAGLIRARKENALNIVILGGSVPYGTGLKTSRLRWSDRLKILLQNILEPIYVNVTNLAIPATPSHVQAQTHFAQFLPTLNQAHVVIVDISMNDRPSLDGATDDGDSKAHMGQRLMELLLAYTSQSTGIVYFETFTAEWIAEPLVHRPEQLQQCTANQKWTRGDARLFMPNNCIIYAVDVARNFHWCSLLELQIPVISYPDVICYYSSGPQRLRDPGVLWGQGAHPSAEVHQFVSNVVGMSLAEVFAEVLRSVESHQHKNDELAYNRTVSETGVRGNDAVAADAWDRYMQEHPVDLSRVMHEDRLEIECDLRPATVLSSQSAATFVALFQGADWWYGEDRKGKPGWIANSTRNGTPRDRREITFGLQSLERGGVGIIRLELLKSYSQDMGALSCCVNCEGGENFVPSKTFYTRWVKKESQSVTVGVPFKGENGHVAFENNTTRSAIIRCRADDGKVKILSVIAC
jgi:hypothetical protein